MAVLPVFVVIKYARERRRLAGLKRQYAGRYWYKSPFQGEPAQIYALLKRDHKTTFERLIASYLMNWLIKGVIAPQKVKAQGILRREKTQIRLDQAYRPSGYLETELYTVFQLACADGFVTDQKQLARIIRLRSSQIQAWPARVEKDSQQFLFESGFIVEAAAKLELTWRGREFNGSLFMFANFLRDFAQRQSQLAQSENELDSLMGWAILFGLSDELQRHYQALFPGRYSSSMATGDALAWTRMLSNNLASASSSSSSSSSSGGGGGSFGGGSGGGTR